VSQTGLYYYGARYYSAWLGRFLSVDPLQHDYPYYTPYQYAGNKPVTYIDLDGLEEMNTNNSVDPPKVNTGDDVFDKTANLTVDTYGFSENSKVEIDLHSVEGELVYGSISLTEDGLTRTITYDFQKGEFTNSTLSIDDNYTPSPNSVEADNTNRILPKPVILGGGGSLSAPSFPIPDAEIPQLGVSKMDTWTPEARAKNTSYWESIQAIKNYEAALKKSDPIAFGGAPGFGNGYVSDLYKGLEQMPDMYFQYSIISYIQKFKRSEIALNQYSKMTTGKYKGLGLGSKFASVRAKDWRILSNKINHLNTSINNIEGRINKIGYANDFYGIYDKLKDK
jgi:hypothetical protein